MLRGNQTFQKKSSPNTIWCEPEGGARHNSGRWHMGTSPTVDPTYVYHFLGCCNPPRGRWNTFEDKQIAFQNVQLECSFDPCAGNGGVSPKRDADKEPLPADDDKAWDDEADHGKGGHDKAWDDEGHGEKGGHHKAWDDEADHGKGGHDKAWDDEGHGEKGGHDKAW